MMSTCTPYGVVLLYELDTTIVYCINAYSRKTGSRDIMKGWKVANIYNNIGIYARPLCSSKHDAFKEKREKRGEREREREREKLGTLSSISMLQWYFNRNSPLSHRMDDLHTVDSTRR